MADTSGIFATLPVYALSYQSATLVSFPLAVSALDTFYIRLLTQWFNRS